VVVGNKVYKVCMECYNVVCLNKAFFGDVHFCTEGE
jgi:hypothetical protein